MVNKCHYTDTKAEFNILGLKAMYYLTLANRKANIYLEAWDGEVRTANYSTFYIDNESALFALHVSEHNTHPILIMMHVWKTHQNALLINC